MLRNEKILFIAPSFFGYEMEIKKYLTNEEAIVEYIDDRMSNSFIYKVLNRIKFPFIDLFNTYVFGKKTKKLNHDYSYIFIIKCEGVTKKSLIDLKYKNKDAIFILYLWDSISNIRGIEKKLKYFNRVYSFDMKDCENHPNIIYRPLFFLDKFMVEYQDRKILYDACFIGTDHGDRKKVINSILKKNSKLAFFIYMYSPSKLMSYLKKIFRLEMKSLILIRFNKLSIENMIEIINSSSVVIDINNQNQDGLTIRTIEAVALNKKIITTNSSIFETDIYNSGNVLIINRKNPQKISQFLEKKIYPYDGLLKKKYTLASFINFIFEQDVML